MADEGVFEDQLRAEGLTPFADGTARDVSGTTRRYRCHVCGMWYRLACSRDFGKWVCSSCLGAEHHRLTSGKPASPLPVTALLRRTDAELAKLNASEVTRLSFLFDAITDRGLEHIGRMTRLESLCLFGTRITDDGLRSLTALQHLETLNVSSTGITDAGLAYLGGMAGLKSLDLTGTHVTDQGLVRLRGLYKLERLNLNKTRIGDLGLTHLGACKTLKHLGLAETDVSGDGLASLIEMTLLESLRLSVDLGLFAGAKRLRETLPRLEITWQRSTDSEPNWFARIALRGK
jgi:hypothetical protein